MDKSERMSKPLGQLLLCRGFALAVLLWPVYQFYAGKTGEALRDISAPSFFLFVFLLLHLGAFPLAYSFLGAKQRTAAPDEETLERGFGGRVGFSKGSMSFYLMRSGVGGWAIGAFFIPLSDITAVELSTHWAEIEHESPEVRSPIRAPRKFGEALAKLRAQASADDSL